MPPRLRLVSSRPATGATCFRGNGRGHVALVERALADLVDSVLDDAARTGRSSQVIGALILLESSRQELERLLRIIEAARSE